MLSLRGAYERKLVRPGVKVIVFSALVLIFWADRANRKKVSEALRQAQGRGGRGGGAYRKALRREEEMLTGRPFDKLRARGE